MRTRFFRLVRHAFGTRCKICLPRLRLAIRLSGCRLITADCSRIFAHHCSRVRESLIRSWRRWWMSFHAARMFSKRGSTTAIFPFSTWALSMNGCSNSASRGKAKSSRPGRRVSRAGRAVASIRTRTSCNSSSSGPSARSYAKNSPIIRTTYRVEEPPRTQTRRLGTPRRARSRIENIGVARV